MAVAEQPGLRPGRRASLGGLLAALILAAVIAAFFSPTADLALFSLASLGIAIAVIEIGWAGALSVFLASGLLGLAYPGLTAVLPLLVFFGPYPLLRAIIDRRFGPRTAFFLRILAGDLLAGLAGVLFAASLVGDFSQKLGSLPGSWFWPVLIIGLQMVLVVYDYALGLLIRFYVVRLKRN